MKATIHILPLFLLAISASQATAAANDRPATSFAGCEDTSSIPPSAENPRNRIDQRNQVNRITKRTFASFSLDELETKSTANMAGLCWFRLDGVWRETGTVALDRSQDNNEIWGSDAPELIALANGTYTTPGFLSIRPSQDPDEELEVTAGLNHDQHIIFESDDGIPLKDVLKRGGVRKTYYATDDFSFGNEIIVDVSRSGRVRLTLGSRTFIRPKAGISKATMSSQIAANDAFLISYNLENLSASRKGYDVVKQDPFYLLQNPKYEIFAEVAPQNYVISEKRTVPLGFTLIQEASQGTVFSKSLVSSENEVQTTIGHTLGAKAKVTVPAGAVPVTVKAGFDASLSIMNSMRESETVSQAIAYSRAKQYALVVDHPYVTLSDDFIDAVEDARRYNKYDDLVRKFGTHYPYAVTYGATAKMTQSFSQASYTRVAEIDGSFRVEAGAKTFGQKGSAYYGINAGKRTGTSGSVGEEGATFVAVGGNGSWNENGYSAGSTPYPVLLDLRPIDELLNPMNFPGEPEVYEGVRHNLKIAVANYIRKNTRDLSNESLLPLVPLKKKEPIETWHVYVKTTQCSGKKVLLVKDVVGTLSSQSYLGQKNKKLQSTRDKSLTAVCSKKKPKKSYKYKSSSPGLLVIKGTRSQIARYVVDYKFSWRYRPNINKKKFRNNSKKFKAPKVLKNGLPKGKYKDVRWSVGAKGFPTFYMNVRFRRVS